MLSFHNDAALKTEIERRLAEHHAADAIIQGTGWNGFKGCAVGCTLNNYSHAAYEKELGLPQWVAHLEDKIFEGLPAEKAPQFARDFLSAIPVGVDIDPVKWRLAILRHQRDLARLEGNAEPYAQECRDAINGVISYCEAQLKGTLSDESARSAARSAWSAAWSAAESARSAESAARSAESAARSAAAWSAAWSAAESAESAARSAESAAWSAARSARSAAEKSQYEWEAETLIKLLKECK